MGYLDYTKFFKLLEKQGHNKEWLRNNGFHPRVVYKMERHENMGTDKLVELCELMNCKLSDIVEYKKGEPPVKE